MFGVCLFPLTFESPPPPLFRGISNQFLSRISPALFLTCYSPHPKTCQTHSLVFSPPHAPRFDHDDIFIVGFFFFFPRCPSREFFSGRQQSTSRTPPLSPSFVSFFLFYPVSPFVPAVQFSFLPRCSFTLTDIHSFSFNFPHYLQVFPLVFTHPMERSTRFFPAPPNSARPPPLIFLAEPVSLSSLMSGS